MVPENLRNIYLLGEVVQADGRGELGGANSADDVILALGLPRQLAEPAGVED